jgi:SAM-dependent methyltransferase
MVRIGALSRAEALHLGQSAWAEVQEPLDRQLSPLGLEAMAALNPRPGWRVLDVGCGAGQTVLQLAQAVGPAGAVSGIDIAPRLLDIARVRAAHLSNVTFMAGDAQTHALGQRSFDGIFSRFGIMAFSDAIAAFRNLRGALKRGGRLAFVCWRSLAENELDNLPVRAAGLERLVDLTAFSFSDRAMICEVLGEAGFRDVFVKPHDRSVVCGDLDATLAVVLKVGALGRILRERPSLGPEVGPAVRRALEARQGPGGVALGAATWVVSAGVSG